MSARDQAPAPEMSAATRDVLGRVRRMIPPMLDKFHKGQLGRIAVIGGSEDYTGAPYFSAMASARLGCDMSHVICTPQAGAVIKTYSPNLMVHPLMRQSPSSSSSAQDPNHDGDAEHDAARIIDMLPRLHVLVVGPGLGRDPRMQATVARVVRAARDRDMAVVLDADALQLVQRDPDLVRGYAGAVLTPNVVEFGRLWDSLKLGQQQQQDGAAGETGKVEAMAKALGGVTIIQKGKADLISNGKSTLTDDLEGGRKRSGGQGDTLTGSESSRLAFLKRGRSLQASDLTDEVHNAFIGLFGEIDGDSGSYKL
ncbi:carbohydrate kinase domain-containing protein [Hirsutella rhossiliensis]